MIRTTKLRVTLLHITQRLGQHLNGDFLVVSEEMTLACISSIVDERVGIGCDTCDAGEDIARRGVRVHSFRSRMDLPVQEEDLFTTTACPCFDALASGVASTSERQIQELSCHFL